MVDMSNINGDGVQNVKTTACELLLKYRLDTKADVLAGGDKVIKADEEYLKGMNVTKLPGGGLEYGEGTIECVVREFKEELDLDIEVVSHFYTTDFFVNSAFSSNNQVLSIYYLVKPKEDFNAQKVKFKIATKLFDFEKKMEGAQSMRWVEIEKISDNDFTEQVRIMVIE